MCFLKSLSSYGPTFSSGIVSFHLNFLPLYFLKCHFAGHKLFCMPGIQRTHQHCPSPSFKEDSCGLRWSSFVLSTPAYGLCPSSRSQSLMGLAVFSFFSVLEVCWVSWICGSIAFISFGKLQQIPLTYLLGPQVHMNLRPLRSSLMILLLRSFRR